MKRENRYTVLKHTDIHGALDADETELLIKLENKITSYRKKHEKEEINCVVIEHDWPMYESAWNQIEEWVDEGIKKQEEEIHVDTFIEFGSMFSKAEHEDNEDYARWVLNYFRLPAAMKIDFNKFMSKNKLFCTFKNEIYRVTGASRLGDIWITKDFNQSAGYQKRVMINNCSGWANYIINKDRKIN